MKKSIITSILIVLMSMIGVNVSAHNIEVANADGVTIYYIWTNNNTELAVTYRGSYYDSYRNSYSGNVVIPESVEYNGTTYKVTSIGESAFRECSGLTSVTIPGSVTSIGWCAFSYCRGLTSITIPGSVTSIGESAFRECSGLTSVTIPDGVTSIGQSAFSGCTGLTSVTIPESVTSIGSSAFSGCDNCAVKVVVTDLVSFCNNQIIGLIGNKSISLINAEGNEIKDCVIPNEVTSIGDRAFYNCTGLTSLTIPESVTSIGNYTFYGCKGLTSVNYLCSPTSIGSNVFSNCTNIQEVTFDCNNVPSLFSGKTSITKVTFTDKVTSIGYEAFYGCSGLISVIIPNSVNSIGDYAFGYCSNLTSVIIGSGVTSIGSYAFNNTNLKKTIWLTNTPPSGYTYASGAVNYVSNDQYTSLENVIKYQFLSSYFDVDGIRYVPVSPSERTCDAIDCVYDDSAENTRISSTAVYKGVTMTVKNIQPYLAYNNKFIKTLTIDNDGELSDYAFTDCSNMQSVMLGQKVSAIGASAFQGCSSIEEIDIPEIVTVMEKSSFSGCSSLKAIKIKPKMTEIKDYAFYNCTSLKEVIIVDSEEELMLGSNERNPIFASCPLDSVYIGRNINYSTDQYKGYSPFYRNTSLRAVKITDKETEISANEFYGCNNLQRVIIGDGVTTIGDWAFSGCQSLKYFAFGSQVQTIGKEAFSDCTSVIEIISKASTAPVCGSQALDDINKWECKLYVPNGCLAAYQTADQWKDFFFSEEGEGTAEQGGEEQNKGKCKAPNISIKGGKLMFASETNGVIFHYSITHSDVKNDITNGEVGLTNTYIISAYASKEGYENSDGVNAEILVKGGGGDLNDDGVVNAADVVTLVNIISEQ